MLHLASRIRGLTLLALDGEIGAVDDLYFDDERWTVRYLVVNTGAWLGRRVLIPPMAVASSWTGSQIPVRLTRAQVKASPAAATHEPVSRVHESALLEHYGYPVYWGGDGLWGAYAFPAALLGATPEPIDITARPPATVRTSPASKAVEPHLRSASEIVGYHIQASDGEIGHVDDLLIDDRSWQIHFLQVDTSNWIGGKAVAVSPRLLRGIDFSARRVNVSASREEVKASPPLESIALPPSETSPPFVII